MFDKFFPDRYVASTYVIDFEGLYNNEGLFKKRLFRNGIFEAILVEYRPEEGGKCESLL